jgi:wyosine [tRNA(Phe)-imidazoG37] synthetase (radical SAM superfamily)
MIDKSKLICATPFGYTEVFDDKQFLCCPGWLKEDIYETNNIKDNFNSKKSQEIRKSILDGSYKYCDENQCPHLSALKQDKFIDRRFVPKTAQSLERYKPISTIGMVNFCFDRSCNLQCPSCRNELINYLGKDRDGVDDKLRQVNDELSQTIKRLYLSGSADPFFSKSFRQFLIDFDPTKYPNMERIHIHTNGILWTEQLWNRMKTIHPFVKTCEISIDAATKHTYEKIVRIGGNWDTLITQLNFIIEIPTISGYIFSFVVQDSNYKEMFGFYELIKNINKVTNKNINIFFNHITNWGTYSESEYLSKDISNPNHELHEDFLIQLDKIHNQKNVSHNFNHLLETKINLI